MQKPIASEESVWTGVWWLPAAGRREAAVGDADRRTGESLGQGSLTYEPGVGLRLRLAGFSEVGIRPLEALAFDEGHVPVLHGRLLDGEPCTLLNADVRDHTSWVPAGGWCAVVRVNTAIFGTHVEAEDELQFASADLRIRGLREFLRQPPLTPRSGESAFQQEGDRNFAKVDIDRAQITFGLGWASRSTRDSSVREVDASVLVKLEEPAPLPAWDQHWARRLHDLVVFGTREPTWIETFTAIMRDEGAAEQIHPAIRRGGSDEAWERRLVYVVRAPSVLLRGVNERSYSRVVLGAGDLGSGFSAFIRNWFALNERLGGASGFLIGSLNAPSEYLENRLLNLTGFAEAYHRTCHDEPPLSKTDHKRLKTVMLQALENEQQRTVYRSRLQHANQQTQRKRFEWLTRRAADVLEGLGSYVAMLPGQLTDTRNYLAHLDEPGQNVVEGSDLYWAITRFVLVLQANLLCDLGVEPGQVRALLRRSYSGIWP